MKIITLSAKARHGKDFTASILQALLLREGKKVLICHYADLLKYICKTFFGWNGEKDEKGRSILQYVGTDVVREKEPDYWVDFLISIFKLFSYEWDYVLIPDTRFPNEINKLKKAGFDVTSIRINRPNFDNGLTEEQKNHPSETALDDYDFDYYISNDGTVKGLAVEVNKILKNIKEEHEGL